MKMVQTILYSSSEKANFHYVCSPEEPWACSKLKKGEILKIFLEEKKEKQRM